MLLVFCHRQRLVHCIVWSTQSTTMHPHQNLPILQRGFYATAELLVSINQSNQSSFISGMTERKPAIHKSNTHIATCKSSYKQKWNNLCLFIDRCSLQSIYFNSLQRITRGKFAWTFEDYIESFQLQGGFAPWPPYRTPLGAQTPCIGSRSGACLLLNVLYIMT